MKKKIIKNFFYRKEKIKKKNKIKNKNKLPYLRKVQFIVINFLF